MDGKKRFVITRGMVLIGVILLLIVLILLIIFIKPKKRTKKSTITLSDCKKLEERIEDEAPMYVYQKNLELSNEPIRINLDDLLSKNGGSINESKYKAVKFCKGYVVATRKEKEEYNGFISCGDVYTTKGYAGGDNKVTTTSKTKIKDTEKPVISLIGDPVVEIFVGNSYRDLGAKAVDNVDGDITAMIKVSGSVDNTKAGEYTIKYMVTDKNNNSAEVERKIIVKNIETTTTTSQIVITTTQPRVTTRATTRATTRQSNVPPTIVLRGNQVININTGGTYVDPGYTATDSSGRDITSSVIVSGSVNTKIAGTYVLTYSVKDRNGNSAVAKRTIVVNSKTVIEVKSISLTPNSIELSVGQTKHIEISINPNNATNKNITWSSSDNSVVTVSSDGTITARKKGTAAITAKSDNGVKAVSRVNVK